MTTKQDLEHYKKYFDELGVIDENDIIGIINFLKELAEITYYIYKKAIKL